MQTAIATSLKGFLLTSAAWKEVPQSLCQEIPKIAEQLNQQINFHDFGTGVESLLFIAVMVPPTHDDHHNDSDDRADHHRHDGDHHEKAAHNNHQNTGADQAAVYDQDEAEHAGDSRTRGRRGLL